MKPTIFASAFNLAIALFTLVIPAAAVAYTAHPVKKTSSVEHTLVLYDPSRGTMPDAQGWSLLTLGGTETPPGKTGGTTFSTLSDNAIQGGYLLLAPKPLERQRGYALEFDLQVIEEAHAEPNRAGVSLIVLGADGIGLELGFWKTEVWAQSDHPLFLHAEGAAFQTSGSRAGRLVHYVLAMRGQQYHLSANGTPLLSGPLRDYRAFKGPISPYQTPNLIFLGDDTKSARGKVRVGKITLLLHVPKS